MNFSQTYKKYGLRTALHWHVWGGLSSSGAVVLGVKVFGSHYKKAWWHKAFIMPIYRTARTIHDMQDWILYRLSSKHQYHIIRPKIKPGYYEPDYMLLQGCFACLERYIEESGGVEKLTKFTEDLKKSPDANAPPELEFNQIKRQSEALALWHWWTITKPQEEDERDTLLHECYSKPLETKEVTVNGQIMYEMIPPTRTPEEEEKNTRFRALERKIDDDEQIMLHRLIDIRRSLWT